MVEDGEAQDILKAHRDVMITGPQRSVSIARRAVWQTFCQFMRKGQTKPDQKRLALKRDGLLKVCRRGSGHSRERHR